jgi:chemotaxis protein MotB
VARKSKNSDSDAGPDPNAWMATFADLVMLLLTFFVLLLTMSSMDQKMLREVFSHLKEATGVLGFSGSRQVDFDSFVKEHGEKDTKLILDNHILANMFEVSIKSDKKMKDVSDAINISEDERGLVLSFQEYILFDSGEAELKKEAFDVLDVIATSIESCDNVILVMGHTDNIPIYGGEFESNWELSLYRGLSVLEYFTEKKDIPPQRFYVGGYGDARPLYPNDTPRHRAANRRVEIIFKNIQEE